jgi:hypothetical protein
MTAVQWILLIWMAGWLASACSYALYAMKSARLRGAAWSPFDDLLSLTMLLFTWAPSLVMYLYMWLKATVRKR